MKIKKNIFAFIIALTVLSSLVPVNAYEFPNSFWQMNKKYEEAVNAGNNEDIIKYGNQIIDFMHSQPNSDEKDNVMVGRYDRVGRAYAELRDYTSSAETYRNLYEYVIPLGDDYYDYVKSSKAKYEQYTPEMEIYTDGGVSPYYGEEQEKRNGVLFGLCSTSPTRNKIDNESMTIIYQELGQSLLSYNKEMMKNAAQKGIAVEFALNCPKQAKDINNIDSMKSYLKEISDMFNTYNNVPVYLRFAAEFDIWTNLADAQSYKKAFRYVSDYFKSRNSNVAMVWSPNHVSDWNIDIDDYYPGDEYVDWVGMSSYAQKYFLGDKNQTEVNEIVFKTGANSNPVIAVKDIVKEYGDRKPIMISESGCGHKVMQSGEDASEFALKRLKQYYSYLPMVYPQIKLIAYFDQYIDGEKNDYRLTSNKDMQDEFIKLTKGERFVQDEYSNDVNMCYRKIEDGMRLGSTFLLSCYAHQYDNDTKKVTYYIDDKYVGMSSGIPFSVYADSTNYSGTHTLKAVAEFADGSMMTKETEVVFADNFEPIDVEIAGDTVDFDQEPVIYNDRTLVPMRKIFEELDADVSWDADTRTITGTRGDRTVKVSVGSCKMYVNHKEILLDTPPIILRARTLVPARAVAEGMGCEVDWNGSRRLVSITPRVFEWSDWENSLPNDVDDDLFYIERRDEYRTRTRTREKEYFTLNDKYSAGNYVREETSYGDWDTDWQNDYISENENRDVETRTVSEPIKYKYYHYCTGYTDDSSVRYKTANYWFSDLAIYHELGTYDYSLPYAADGNGGQVLYNEDGSYHRCSNSCYRWYEEQIGGSYTQYRSRPIYHKYVYWTWSDWSDWSRWSDWTEGVAPNSYNFGFDEETETDSRTLYRYKEK